MDHNAESGSLQYDETMDPHPSACIATLQSRGGGGEKIRKIPARRTLGQDGSLFGKASTNIVCLTPIDSDIKSSQRRQFVLSLASPTSQMARDPGGVGAIPNSGLFFAQGVHRIQARGAKSGSAACRDANRGQHAYCNRECDRIVRFEAVEQGCGSAAQPQC